MIPQTHEEVPDQLAQLINATRTCDGKIQKPLPTSLNIMHWNINRLPNKISEVEAYIDSFDGILHVVIISETWLSQLTLQTVNLMGYEHVHNYRDGKEGGGISIFVHQSLCMGDSIEIMSNEVTSDFNHFLVIKIPGVSQRIAVAYRRPLSNVTDFTNQLIQKCLIAEDCILLGDFNLNILDVTKLEMLNMVLEPNGYMIVNKIDAAFATRRASGTILDLVITNVLNNEYLMSVIHNQSSDHSVLFVSAHNCINETRTRNGTRQKFKIHEAVVKTAQLLQDNTFVCGNELNGALANIVQECTVEVRLKSNHRTVKAHTDQNLVREIRERDRLFHLKSLYPRNEILSRQYDEKAEYVKQKRRQLRSAYECERFNNAANDPGKIWKLYKEIVFNRKEVKNDPVITVNGVPTTNTRDSCNLVNQRFCSAGSELATGIIGVHGYSLRDVELLYPEYERNCWSFSSVDANDVLEVIRALPNKKSNSFDEIPISLLKQAAADLAPVVANCFNESVRTSTYPSEMLKGRLKLIHKAGDNDLGNFRGLTILPNKSKIYEQVLVNQLMTRLDEIDFFSGDQYGFLKNSSCEGAAVKLVDAIKSQYRRKYVACIFVDLKRAFDTVDTQRLICKLKCLGLTESSLALMSSYLTNRVTATRLFDTVSDFEPVEVGIPQGAKLGPLQFIVYINDLLKLHFKGKIILYADDAVLTYASEDQTALQEMMQHDMNIMVDWLHQNVMTINAQKTCYMLFGRARSLGNIVVNVEGVAIERVSNFRYLGLILDEKLCFDAHVKHVKRQVIPFIPLMWRNARHIPLDKRKPIYFAYVHSHLSYMLSIWGGSSRATDLQVIQNKCLKALYGLKYDTPTTYLYSASLMPVSVMSRYARLLLVHKMANGMTKHTFSLPRNNEVYSRATRQSAHLHIPNPRHADSFGLLMDGMADYNGLNDEMKCLGLETFKRRLKNLCMQESSGFALFTPFRHLN